MTVLAATLILYVSGELVPMIEPYLGVGVVNGTGELSVNGSNAVFSDPTFQANRKATATVSSPQVQVGIEFKMGTIRMGFEYSQQFGVGSYTGKFSLVPFYSWPTTLHLWPYFPDYAVRIF